MGPKKNIYGCTEWGGAFIGALGARCGRLDRGKTLANTGKVLQTTIEGTKVHARVQGSSSPYYDVSITFRSFSSREREEVFNIIEQDPILLGHIMNGELPSALLTRIAGMGRGKQRINLLPTSFDEVKGNCDCPDNQGGGGYYGGSWKSSGEPCKHQAAVYYVLTREIDQNPFMMFLLRGVDMQKRFNAVRNAVRVPYPLPIQEAAHVNLATGGDHGTLTASSVSESHCASSTATAVAMGVVQNQAALILSCLQSNPSFCPQLDYREVLAEFYTFLKKDKNLESLSLPNASEWAPRIEALLQKCRFQLRMDRDITCACCAILPPLRVDTGDAAGNRDAAGDESTLGQLHMQLDAVKVVHWTVKASENEVSEIRLAVRELLQLLLGMQGSFGSSSFAFLVHASRLSLQLLRRAAVLPDVLPLSGGDDGRFKVIWKPLGTDAGVASAVAALQDLYPASAELDLGGVSAMDGVPQSAHAGTRQVMAVLATGAVMGLGFMHAKMRKKPPAVSRSFFGREAFSPLALQDRSVGPSVSRWVGVFDLLKLPLRVSVLVSDVVDDDASLSLAMLLSDHSSSSAASINSRGLPVCRFVLEYPQQQPAVLQFLSSLGRYLPGVERLLSHERLQLTGLRFEQFITVTAATLSSLGCEMVMPKRLQRLMRPRLVLHASGDPRAVQGNQAYQTYLDVQGLLQFEWRVAIGDQQVSLAEFEAMARAGRAVVAFRDGFVTLDAQQVSGMLQRAKIDATAEAQRLKLSPMDLLRDSLTPDSSFTFSQELQALMHRLTGHAEGLGPASEAARRHGGKDESGGGGIAPPDALQATMRPYQLTGFRWLAAHAANGMGCLLSDDMGLGKTLQVIALMLHMRSQRIESARAAAGAGGLACLVVVPASLLCNWQREIARFAPALRCAAFYGEGRQALLDRLLGAQPTPCKQRPADGACPDGPVPKRQRRTVDLAGLAAGAGVEVVLTTYGTCKRETAVLGGGGRKWDLLVLDEAQAVKNAAAQTARAVKGIAARARVALSGTPVENKLAELHSLMDFAVPGLLGSLKAFGEQFGKPIERLRDAGAVQRLRQITGPFMLRRMKTDPSVITDLPPKVSSDDFAALHPAQASLYESVVQRHLAEIEAAQGGRKALVLKLITALKQVCNHPASFSAAALQQLAGGTGVAAMEVEEAGGTHVQRESVGLSAHSALGAGGGKEEEDRERSGEPSGKVELLLELLDPVLAAGEKALVFTQYRSMAALLLQILAARTGVTPLQFHGGLTQQQRDAAVWRFGQDPCAQLMVVTLKAGGVGLNLTAANHVIHFDLWWNPAVESQATDRAFRIGQEKTVFVHRLITKATFEEKINHMLQAKRELSDLTVSAGEEWLADLSPAQLRELFSLSNALSEPA